LDAVSPYCSLQVPGDPEPDAWIETVIKAALVLNGTEIVPLDIYQGVWLQDLKK